MIHQQKNLILRSIILLMARMHMLMARMHILITNFLMENLSNLEIITEHIDFSTKISEFPEDFLIKSEK